MLSSTATALGWSNLEKQTLHWYEKITLLSKIDEFQKLFFHRVFNSGKLRGSPKRLDCSWQKKGVCWNKSRDRNQHIFDSCRRKTQARNFWAVLVLNPFRWKSLDLNSEIFLLKTSPIAGNWAKDAFFRGFIRFRCSAARCFGKKSPKLTKIWPKAR